VSVVYVPDHTGPDLPVGAPRVAFAITRRAGSAVVRNRIRRRARAALTALSARPDSPLVPGAYLVSTDHRAAELPFPELAQLLEAAVRAATARPADGGAP
jgi:ribonuclease P protein component